MSDNATPVFSLFEADKRTRARRRSEFVFRMIGFLASFVGLLALVMLFWTIFSNGMSAFQQAKLLVPVELVQSEIDEAEAATMKTSVYQDIIVKNLLVHLEDIGFEPMPDEKLLGEMISKRSGFALSEYALAHPDEIGSVQEITFLASGTMDRYFKGQVTRENIVNNRKISEEQLDLADALREVGVMDLRFNWDFLTGHDASKNSPEAAGIGASVLGSLAMMIVVLVLSLPIGLMASIYLEEFAPKNRWTDLIEVNVSNLAAVPSIVFGILGLSIFVNVSHLPRSAPLVGGLVLTLMTLPTIIISTRAALRAVPPSIRDAALGIGASKMQTITHHVLPLAMPGILTGLIIGLAQALGESAPLLLIGMVGYVARENPQSLVDFFMAPNSAMPAQIYTWTASDDPAFQERAWGGIIVLLGFLVLMNLVAILLRRRFERRW